MRINPFPEKVNQGILYKVIEKDMPEVIRKMITLLQTKSVEFKELGDKEFCQSFSPQVDHSKETVFTYTL